MKKFIKNGNWKQSHLRSKKSRNDFKKIETNYSKVLTYLVLLITVVTILGNLIVTVYTFLQGELNIRFILKASIVLVLVGLFFGFYYLEFKKNKKRGFIIFGLAIIIFVTSGIIFGFLRVEYSSYGAFDRQRERDLADLANCIKNYAQEFNRLPDSLKDLEKNYSYCAGEKDPKSGMPYGYNITNVSLLNMAKLNMAKAQKLEFGLCANFDFDSHFDEVHTNVYRPPKPLFFRLISRKAIMSIIREGTINNFKSYKKWSTHNQGYYCIKDNVIVKSSLRINFLWYNGSRV